MKDGAEAIAAYQKAKGEGRSFDAVIMDLTIPGGMGAKAAMENLLMIDPEIKAVVSSGYSDDPVVSDFRRYGFSGVIAKPYNVRELGKVLHGLVDTDSTLPLGACRTTGITLHSPQQTRRNPTGF